MNKLLKNVSVALAIIMLSVVYAHGQTNTYYTDPPTIPIDELLEKISNADEVEDRTRKGRVFAFWNGCRPLGLGIGLSPYDSDLYNSIRNTVESRLRGARLLNDEEAWGFLAVDVHTEGSMFRIRIGLNKNLLDPDLDEMRSAETWGTGSFGTFSSESLIISLISQHTDDFLNTYLRVNEDSCSR